MTMRNRKNVIVAFVLVAVMLMAVGYAALTTDLHITGNATITSDQAQDEFQGKIHFDEVNLATDITTNGTSGAANTLSKTGDKAMNLGVNSLGLDGETATFTFRVINESEHEATASIETIKIMGVELTPNGEGVYTDEWISAKVTWVDSALEASDGVNHGEAEFTITFTLLKSPTTQIVRSINVTIDATTNS